jgi:hypothetical protein
MRPKLEQIDVNRDMAACLLKMGEVEFAVARAEGRAMTFEQAADYALETEPSA